MVPCFTAGTLIRTADGETRIEDLTVGALVATADHGARPVRWIGSRRLDANMLRACPNLRPVRIIAGALGGGLPVRDLLVSPQHRMLVRSRIAATMFGATEVLVAAKHLAGLPGIAVAEETYVHFLCDSHEIVCANGALSETLFTGPVALQSVGAAAREEIFTLFPALRAQTGTPVKARRFLTGREGRKLAGRHPSNNRQLVAAD